jgi:hypothetical protein
MHKGLTAIMESMMKDIEATNSVLDGSVIIVEEGNV